MQRAFFCKDGTNRKWLSYSQEKEALFCSIFVSPLLITQKAARSSLACPTSHTYTRELKSMRRATYTEVALRHIFSDLQEARFRTFSWDLRCHFTESKSAEGDKCWSAL